MNTKQALENAAASQSATSELKVLEERTRLRQSSAAGIVQILGIIGSILSIVIALENIGGGVAALIFSVLSIISGRFYQIIFDIRTILLRQPNSLSPKGEQ